MRLVATLISSTVVMILEELQHSIQMPWLLAVFGIVAAIHRERHAIVGVAMRGTPDLIPARDVILVLSRMGHAHTAPVIGCPKTVLMEGVNVEVAIIIAYFVVNIGSIPGRDGAISIAVYANHGYVRCGALTN